MPTEPAFPNPGHDNGPGNCRSRPSDGMSLRDYFAAKSLQGLLACPVQLQSGADMFARDAYVMADAMLEARNK